MSDLIDRQAAIDALRYAQHRFTVADEAGGMGTVKWSEYVIYFAEAERILTELPSAQPEKRTEKRTETHACDLISRQAAIDACHNWDDGKDAYAYGYMVEERLQELPSAQPEIVRCKDCRWWNKSDDSPFGYCMAIKHGYMSEHWEIGIYRRYKGDFYCADAERGSR